MFFQIERTAVRKDTLFFNEERNNEAREARLAYLSV